MSIKYLKEFEELNTTTDSIYDLGEHEMLVILNDGTNLTPSFGFDKRKVRYISVDFSNRTDLHLLFHGCKSLRAIVARNVTSKVTNLWGMFQDCIRLEDIVGFDTWDTSNVENMNSVFKGCSRLADISSLSNWDTSNAKDMSFMFSGCCSLSDLSALSNWDNSKARILNYMFNKCTSLTNLKGLENFIGPNLNWAYGMFRKCSSLEDITHLSSWDTSNVKVMDAMFYKCSSLEDYSPIENWNLESYYLSRKDNRNMLCYYKYDTLMCHEAEFLSTFDKPRKEVNRFRRSWCE